MSSDGSRISVYDKVFQFVPKPSNHRDHLSVLTYLPCLCNDDGTYDVQNCLTAAENNSLKLDTKVTLGHLFKIYLISLDVVGSIGYAELLYSEVTDSNSSTNGETLILLDNQYKRSFSITNKTCELVEFNIFGTQPIIPRHGVLHLSFTRGIQHHFSFDFVNCPIGFIVFNIKMKSLVVLVVSSL